MQSLFDLNGQVALVTGSGRGLGYFMAEALARAGAQVILNGRTETTLQQAREEMASKGLNVHTSVFDVTNEDEIRMAITTIEQEIGPIRILVNNAGIQVRKPLVEFEEAQWDALMNTNLKGAFLVARNVVKGMISRQSGKIINICSVNSELGRASISPYTASKGGIKMLTKGMAAEWARHNIQVNGLGPGYFKTDLTRALWQDEAFDAWLCQRTPANRWGNPEELGGPIVFLASGASAYMNGHILYVDGGMTASV